MKQVSTFVTFCSVAVIGLSGLPAFAEEPVFTPQPVNCSTAEGDLRALEAEKKHAEEQQAKDIVAITPAGALFGLVTGTEGKKLKVLSSNYIEVIDKRIALIKKTCKLSDG